MTTDTVPQAVLFPDLFDKPPEAAAAAVARVLKDEEKSLRTQLVAIQRAIEAIEGADAPAPAARGKKKAPKVVTKRKRTMTEEQRQAVADRMRKYWASRREAKAEE